MWIGLSFHDVVGIIEYDDVAAASRVTPRRLGTSPTWSAADTARCAGSNVDPVQFRARLDDFDFDITVQRFGFSTLPGALLRTYFSSRAAASKGSQNLAGILDPLVDLLIEKVVAADNRRALVTACKVLDRVVRNGRYWVPHCTGPALARILGRVRQAGVKAALRARNLGNLVV